MAIFFLEVLVRITIQNKDRVNEIWPSVEDHMKKIIEVQFFKHRGKYFLLLGGARAHPMGPGFLWGRRKHQSSRMR